MKRIFGRMLVMCEPAWELLTRALALSCVMLFCAFMLLVDAGSLTQQSYDTYLLARELCTAPQWILLIAVLGSAMIEERRLR